MKLITILLLFAVVQCEARDTNSVTAKVFERDTDKDGKRDQRIETVSRGKDAILRIHTTVRGGITNVARSYFAGGELVMTESDETGDGFFERVAIYNAARKNEMEVFDRARDGTVQPVPTEVLAAYKRQHAAISKFFADFGNEKDVEKAMEKLDAVRQEVTEANKTIKRKK